MNSILIIDDEEIDFLVNSQILKRVGFTKAVYHSSAISALHYLEEIFNNAEEWPSHIFLDINMRHMSGFDFIDAYLKFPGIERKRTKIYIVSSSNRYEDINKGNIYTVVAGYLTKPLSYELVETIFNPAA